MGGEVKQNFSIFLNFLQIVKNAASAKKQGINKHFLRLGVVNDIIGIGLRGIYLASAGGFEK
jgi:hypothetical protein